MQGVLRALCKSSLCSQTHVNVSSVIKQKTSLVRKSEENVQHSLEIPVDDGIQLPFVVVRYGFDIVGHTEVLPGPVLSFESLLSLSHTLSFFLVHSSLIMSPLRHFVQGLQLVKSFVSEYVLP